MYTVTTHTFVGPDNKTYSEHKGDEGGFLSYFDGMRWIMTFPLRHDPSLAYFYYGASMPASATDWKLHRVGTTPPFAP